jgi:hypothetical protein
MRGILKMTRFSLFSPIPDLPILSARPTAAAPLMVKGCVRFFDAKIHIEYGQREKSADGIRILKQLPGFISVARATPRCPWSIIKRPRA